MRIGIIGAGVSGMAAAWLLQDDHDVTLFDRSPHLGGHAETLPVEVQGTTVNAELGVRFFFDRAYPYFLSLLSLLSVPTRWSDARVSVTHAAGSRTMVLPPRSPRHVVALLRSPNALRHLLSLRRLIAEQPTVARERDFSVTFRRHLAENGYPDSFGPELVYPFLAACWGAPLDALPDFPVYSLLKGMPPGNAPGFYEVTGGMSHYIRAFAEQLRHVDIRLGAGVARVRRESSFELTDDRGQRSSFDQLIVATSSRDATALLRGVSTAERMADLVGGFRHFDTEIVVHGDRSLMPRDRRDWAHTNLFFEGELAWMSDWPGIGSGTPVFRTWLPKGKAKPSPLYGARSYHHLIMTPENAILQRRIGALQGEAGLWVTGMYAADVDNHESALLSALVPVARLAPQSKNLTRLLGAVARDAPHGLEVLPVSISVPREGASFA
jgi:predicted NAD/FAD-binding protein